MSTAPKYALTFSLNVLTHLGIGLYSKIPAVLSELVANAWDAAATTVDITLEADRIVIVDDGRGMSAEEVNEQFLKIGYQKRRYEKTVIARGEQRPVMGRKGIGKLSAFSIASQIEVQTVKDGERSGFVMRFSDIEDAIDRDSSIYYPTQLDESAIGIERGTRVELLYLRQKLNETEEELRTELARRFTVVGSDRQFTVVINGRPISLKDRNYYEKIEFMWYLGNESSHYVQRCPNCRESFELTSTVDGFPSETMRGWLATILQPSHVIPQHHVISIFAHGKLIQEDILAEIQEARHVKQYIIGEIDADYLDDGDDIVTSDRQRMNQSDPRYARLLDYVKKRVRNVASKWTPLRNRYHPKKHRSENPEGPLISLPFIAAVPQVTSEVPSIDGSDISPEVDVNDSVSLPVDDGPLPPFSPTKSDNTESAISSERTVDSLESLGRLPQAPAREAQAMIGDIRNMIVSSDLEKSFKTIMLSDLEQARMAYQLQAYKACVVMLGAVVEAMMLGTLRRPEIMDFVLRDADPPQLLGKAVGGLRNPSYENRTKLAESLANNLDYEKMRTVLEHYLPDLKELGVEDIQHFRNAVHPWKCITQPEVYKFGQARAMQHLSALHIIAQRVLSWVP